MDSVRTVSQLNRLQCSPESLGGLGLVDQFYEPSAI